MSRPEVMEIRDCIKFDPDAPRLNVFLDGLVGVADVAQEIHDWEWKHRRTYKDVESAVCDLTLIIARLSDLLKKLDLGITDQDIAETMPPEPGR